MKIVKEAIYMSIFGSTTSNNDEMIALHENEGIIEEQLLPTQSS